MSREAVVDDEIRQRLRAEDLSVLEMIWDRYASDLLGYLVSMLGSRHEAEDVLQDVFVVIARKRASVAKARRLKPYLFRLSRNVALNRIKRKRRTREHYLTYRDGMMLDDGNEGQSERVDQVEAALSLLPEKQRTVLVLKFYRGKTLREIGEYLGISENTAGSRYRYGMKKMQACLQEVSS